MWQRIQTVFLGFVVLIMVGGIFMPLWKHVDASGIRYELYPLHYSVINGDQRDTAYIPYSVTAFLMATAATLAIMTIRRYDNRLTQMKLGALNTLFVAGVMIAAVFFSYKLNNQFGVDGMSRLGLYTLFAAVAFNWLALRFIRRDEKLVRDSDRLR